MNKILTVVLSVAVVLATGTLFLKKSQSPLGADAGPVKTEYQEFIGGNLVGKVNATSTSLSAVTAVAGDVALFDTIIVTKTGAVATTTITLPASSTLPYWLPKVGMRQTQCWISGTSTPANPGFILAAGTGIDLETSSTTATGLTVNGGSGACIEFMRDQLTNLKGFVTIFRDAD
jgi:hypothetical protein